MSNDNTENNKIAQPKAVTYVGVSSKKQAEEGYSKSPPGVTRRLSAHSLSELRAGAGSTLV